MFSSKGLDSSSEKKTHEKVTQQYKMNSTLKKVSQSTFTCPLQTHRENKSVSDGLENVTDQLLASTTAALIRVFIRHWRSENSPFTMQNSLANVW